MWTLKHDYKLVEMVIDSCIIVRGHGFKSCCNVILVLLIDMTYVHIGQF